MKAEPTEHQRADRVGPLRLSFAQERLWFLEQLRPGTAMYNLPLVFWLRGQVDEEALRGAVSDVVARHEVLRTRFPAAGGRPVPVVSDAGEVPWAVQDADGAAALALAQEAVQQPFDLAAGPLLRVRLVRSGADELLLVVVVHHIVFDGWSSGVFTGELAHFYRARAAGRPGDLSELAVQYGDFAVWQREWLDSGVLEDQASYWRERLAGAPPVLELPADRPRPARQSFAGGHEPVVIPPGVAAGLRELCAEAGVTMFMVLLAGFKVLLARYSGQPDVVVGTPIANRARVELEPLIGFFVNTLVLRTDLSGDPTVTELLGRVRETALGAYAHQDLPFEQLVKELRPERDLNRSPLIQVICSLVGKPRDDELFPGLNLEQASAHTGMAKFDLSLFFLDGGDELAGEIDYCADLFDAATVRRMVGHYLTLLESMAAAPHAKLSGLAMLTGPERHQLEAEWNYTQVAWPQHACLHELVEAQADRTPGATAVACGAASLTYQDLDERSNQLAGWLRERQAGPGTVIGLCIERSLELEIALLGVLKSGAAFLPIDPSYPAPRTQFMLADAAVSIVLTQQRLAERFSGCPHVLSLDRDWPELSRYPNGRPGPVAAPEDLAYVTYTSGSTGVPKGVMVEHRSIVNLVRGLVDLAQLDTVDRLLSVTTVTFDVGISDMFAPLACGATLVLADRDAIVDGRALAALLERSGTSVMQATPSLWRMLLDNGWTGDATLRALCGGEAFPPDLAARLTCCVRQVWNVYGPTETTVYSAYSLVSGQDEGLVPIGRPVANTWLFVVDGAMNLVPVGVPGELLVGGAGVARGYLNRPGLTAERFVADPFSGERGERLYRTGDVVRYRPDGVLEYLGRVDDQVKVRGFRVEPGEVENALGRQPGVTACAVMSRADVPGDARLVAYFCAEGAGVSAPGLREALRDELPGYMVPSLFVRLDALPLSSNGKVDRGALRLRGVALSWVARRRAPVTRSKSCSSSCSPGCWAWRRRTSGCGMTSSRWAGIRCWRRGCWRGRGRYWG